MVSRVNLSRVACVVAAFSSAAANSSAAAKSQSVQERQKVLAHGLNQGPPVEYRSMRNDDGWKNKQFSLESDLQKSKNRLYSDPEKLKSMLNTLIVEAKNDTLHSANGFQLQVKLGFLVDSVCSKLNITDVQVITDFKAMMGAELQKYTKNYAAELYLPKTIEKLSTLLIATLEKK